MEVNVITKEENENSLDEITIKLVKKTIAQQVSLGL